MHLTQIDQEINSRGVKFLMCGI